MDFVETGNTYEETVRQMCKAAQCPTRQHHGKSWDTTGDLHETQTELNPLDLLSLLLHAQCPVPVESAESETDEQLVKTVEDRTCPDQSDQHDDH